ncbi:MAG: SpoIIE family protein phosphatase [Gemmatimonadota bacterium]|nr:SpoIIE family protein phosphatase [Gemmatimonadota bacterium]
MLQKEIRVWRTRSGELHLVSGRPLDEHETKPHLPENKDEANGVVREIPGMSDYYYQVDPPHPTGEVGNLLSLVLGGERDTLRVTTELNRRHEEVRLLYKISETLGSTIGLENVGDVIIREVSAVVDAGRASILIYDSDERILRPVAGWGVDVRDFRVISIDDPESVAAKVFRSGQAISGFGARVSGGDSAKGPRPYRGRAYLSVPVFYPRPDGTQVPVGVVNLTDRMGEDAFGKDHEELVTAIAHQIGVVIENARLLARDRQRERVRQEMDLAHDLQLRLLPDTKVLGPNTLVAARCAPADSVGGDFYQFVNFPDDAFGVMLGDVSSHGFGAALIMALVLSAAGIHAASEAPPSKVLSELYRSVESELTGAEMHLALFYGIVEPKANEIRFANAGHPHAFRLSGDGEAERLGASGPPLGLAGPESIGESKTAWVRGEDMLVLFTDGLTEATNREGEPFGEHRVLECVTKNRNEDANHIVEQVFKAVESFAHDAADDRTLVVIKA